MVNSTKLKKALSDTSLRRLNRASEFLRFAVSPIGTKVCGTEAYGVKVWDIVAGELLSEFPKLNVRTFPAFSPDGRWLLVDDLLLDAHTYEIVAQNQIQIGANVMFSPDNTLIACWSWWADEDIGAIRMIYNRLPHDNWEQHRLWEFRWNWQEPFERAANVFEEVGRSVSLSLCRMADVAFTPDSRKLAFSTLHATVGMLDVQTGRLLWEVQTQSHDFSGVRGHPQYRVAAPVAISPNGCLVAHGLRRSRGIPFEDPGSHPRAIEVRYVETGELFHTFWAESKTNTSWDAITGVSFSPNGRFLATSRPVQIWDLSTLQLVCNLPEGGGGDMGLTFTSDGAHLVSGRGGIQVWDLPPNVF